MMQPRQIRREVVDDRVRLSAVLHSPAGKTPLFYEYKADPSWVADGAEPFAAALLLPAMRSDQPLKIAEPISPLLAFSLPRLSEIFNVWWPDRQKLVPLELTPKAEPMPKPVPRGATFFSGGVDSFYTLLKHRREDQPISVPMSHVIFMRGVENRLGYAKGVNESEAWVREVARELGVEVVVGSSNVRSRFHHLHWERIYFGSCLASIALSLSPGFGYICLPSAWSYENLVPHGSSPLTDERYSTESQHILHDGSEVTRAGKVVRIMEWERDLALRYLRVCVLNQGGAYNCGRCKKCVRTAMPIRALGLWDRVTTFRDKSTDHWEAVASRDHAVFNRENLEVARQCGDRWLAEMLERVLARGGSVAH